MEIDRACLSRPGYGTGTYIRTRTIGPIAEFRAGCISLEIFVNYFKIFSYYLEAWSKIGDNRFGLFVWLSSLLFLWLIN